MGEQNGTEDEGERAMRKVREDQAAGAAVLERDALRARLPDTERQLREAEKDLAASKNTARSTMEHKFAIERRIEEIALEFAKDYPDIESCNATQRLYATEQTLRGLADANDDVHAALREAQERADKAETQIETLHDVIEGWRQRCERLEAALRRQDKAERLEVECGQCAETDNAYREAREMRRAALSEPDEQAMEGKV